MVSLLSTTRTLSLVRSLRGAALNPCLRCQACLNQIVRFFACILVWRRSLATSATVPPLLPWGLNRCPISCRSGAILILWRTLQILPLPWLSILTFCGWQKIRPFETSVWVRSHFSNWSIWKAPQSRRWRPTPRCGCCRTSSRNSSVTVFLHPTLPYSTLPPRPPSASLSGQPVRPYRCLSL